MSEVKKEEPAAISQPEYSRLSVSLRNEGVEFFLIKNFIYESLCQLKTEERVGTVTAETDSSSGRTRYSVSLLPLNIYPLPPSSMITEFNVEDRPSKYPVQYVFSHTPETGYVRVVGKVVGSKTVSPVDEDKFSEALKLLSKPSDRYNVETVSVDTAPKIKAAYKPEKREKRDRRVTKSEDQIRSDIFRFFREHPSGGSIKDIKDFVDQNESNVKKVLEKIAICVDSTRLWVPMEDYR